MSQLNSPPQIKSQKFRALIPCHVVYGLRANGRYCEMYAAINDYKHFAALNQLDLHGR
jgi:hypothetical protein